MLIALNIFLGFLLFDLFVACCIYFRKDRQFKEYQYQPKHISKAELDRLLRILAKCDPCSSIA